MTEKSKSKKDSKSKKIEPQDFFIKLKSPSKNANDVVNKNINKKNIFLIEGGGTKGVFAIGILKYLFEPNKYIQLSDINIFGGTSVGSYFALALSIGYDVDDALRMSKILDLNSLIDSKYLFMLTFYRYLKNGYLYDDEGRQKIIKQILGLKIDQIKNHLNEDVSVENITIGHLKKLITLYPNIYKHLIINAVDINTNNQIFFTTLNDQFDEIKLLDIALASSAIPFIFKPTILYQYPDGTYGYKKQIDATTNSFYDGGISTNNPMDYFLINKENYYDYNIWLLKFKGEPKYVKIDNNISLLKELVNYLVIGKNDVKTELIEDEYEMNVINLHSNEGTLRIYSQEEIQKIIDDVYAKCQRGELQFINY